MRPSSTEKASLDRQLACKFRRLRERLGLSREDVAVRLECSPTLVSGYEDGTKPIPLRAIVALGVDGADLLQELADALREGESVLPPEQLVPALAEITTSSSGVVLSLTAAHSDAHVSLAEAADIHDRGLELERTARRIRVGAARAMRAIKGPVSVRAVETARKSAV